MLFLVLEVWLRMKLIRFSLISSVYSQLKQCSTKEVILANMKFQGFHGSNSFEDAIAIIIALGVHRIIQICEITGS